MVERVSTGPQVGGRNLSELVAKRASQQQLLSSVSGPPAAANVPSAPEPKPIDPPKVPDRDDALDRARERAQQTQTVSPNIRRAVQVNTSAQVRQLVGDAIQNAAQGGGPPAQTLNTIPEAGVASQPPAPAPPDSAPPTPAPPVDISLSGTSGGPTAGESGAARPGGNIETQTVEGRPPAVAESAAPNPAPPAEASAPETAPAVELQPQAAVPAVPDIPETGDPEGGQGSGDNSEPRGDVVNVVA